MSEINSITPEKAARFVKEGKAVLVDVRTVNEVVALSIPDSVYIPEPLVAVPKLNEVVGTGKSIIFYCHSGMRSDEMVRKFGKINNGDVWSLQGGIVAWRKGGFSTESTSKVISVERQTQIIAGSLIILSVFLGLTVDKAFFGGTVFFGAGLLFTGLSGSCIMGLLLRQLPWNKL